MGEVAKPRAPGTARDDGTSPSNLREAVKRPSTERGPGSNRRAAMCVRSVDDQGVLQFTLIHAVGCVLHRRASRAIRRLQLFRVGVKFGAGRRGPHLASAWERLGKGTGEKPGEKEETFRAVWKDSLMRARHRASERRPGQSSHGLERRALSPAEKRGPPTLSNPERAGLGYKAKSPSPSERRSARSTRVGTDPRGRGFAGPAGKRGRREG